MILPTICALATARMNCAIHIIRVSGSQAFKIVNQIINKPLPYVGYKVHRANIIDNQKIIDDVLISTFVAPRSYTGEDVIEINCHGGVVLADYIIKLLIRHGASMASPGEFSQRALLNKKIDVTQAEAINNLVHSKNELSIYGATNALVGKLSDDLKVLHDDLFSLIGQIEVNIDYPEFDDVPQISETEALHQTDKLIKKVKKLIIESKRFIPLNEGIRTVIIGDPNVGKSSLLNALSQTDKAIVSDIAGTTRDIVESSININGITLKLFDTAGIRQTENEIEKIGIEKAIDLLKHADLVLILKPLSEYDHKLNDLYQELVLSKNCLIVYTKADLVAQKSYKLNDNEVVISVVNHEIDSLVEKIKHLFEYSEFMNSDQMVLQSNRQIAIFEALYQHLLNAKQALENHLPLDLVIDDYQQANLKLNQILGNGNEYDFLDELFKNFCLGK